LEEILLIAKDVGLDVNIETYQIFEEKAKELGLVDELGSKDEVIAYIEGKEGIKADVVKYKKEETLLDVLSKVLSKQSFFAGKGIGSALLDKKIASTVSIST